jgi:hypothetical protein
MKTKKRRARRTDSKFAHVASPAYLQSYLEILSRRYSDPSSSSRTKSSHTAGDQL